MKVRLPILLESQSLERLRRLIYLLSFVISLHIIMNLYFGFADDDWAGSSIAPMHAMPLKWCFRRQ